VEDCEFGFEGHRKESCRDAIQTAVQDLRQTLCEVSRLRGSENTNECLQKRAFNFFSRSILAEECPGAIIDFLREGEVVNT